MEKSEAQPRAKASALGRKAYDAYHQGHRHRAVRAAGSAEDALFRLIHDNSDDPIVCSAFGEMSTLRLNIYLSGNAGTNNGSRRPQWGRGQHSGH